METYIALYRGINVGGNYILPMKELRAALAANGFGNPRTYIQSGNVVFEREETAPGALAEELAELTESAFGFRRGIVVFPAALLKEAIRRNPFPDAEAEPQTLHLYFLAETPGAPDFDKMREIKKPGETFELIEEAFYLHAPEGIGRSKLAASAERLLGVAATARNWRAVCKLREMAEAE